ncbi:MAG TPA: hypothetical protein VMV93_14700, partial [Chloroflexota bacterium]|nr:hypothetical protein [Chloroflexota bacterium]
MLSSLMLTSGAAAQTSPSAVPAPPPITPGVVPTALESLITGTAPASETVTVNTSSGGVAAAGNTAFSFPTGAFGAATGNVTIN